MYTHARRASEGGGKSVQLTTANPMLDHDLSSKARSQINPLINANINPRAEKKPSFPTKRDPYSTLGISRKEFAERKRAASKARRSQKQSNMWEEHANEASGETYYHNTETNITTWEKPQGYVSTQV